MSFNTRFIRSRTTRIDQNVDFHPAQEICRTEVRQYSSYNTLFIFVITKVNDIPCTCCGDCREDGIDASHCMDCNAANNYDYKLYDSEGKELSDADQHNIAIAINVLGISSGMMGIPVL